MRADSKHSPAAHCDFACGRSGLSCNGGGSGTPQAPWCTERSSSHDARLSVCTYLHTCGDAGNGEIGAAGRVGWVGWLDTGLGSMHTARPTPPSLRRYLALFSSLNPQQPYRRLRVLLHLSLFLSPTFLRCLSSPLPFPLSLFPSPDTYSSICPYRSLLFSSRLVNRRIPRGEEEQGGRDKSGRVGFPRGSEEDTACGWSWCGGNLDRMDARD